jgi:PAS domain S-box-containing protein
MALLGVYLALAVVSAVPAADSDSRAGVLRNGQDTPSEVPDIQDLKTPARWNAHDLLRLLAIVGGLALLALAGFFLQRREVKLLRSSEERFRALIEHSFDVTLVLNPDGSAKYISPAGVRLIGGGKPGKSVSIGRLTDVIHPDDLPLIAKAHEEVLEEPGRSRRVSGYRIQTGDGSLRYAEAIGTNCLHVPGVEGVVVNVRDITERKLAEDELRQLNSELERRISERTRELVAANQQLKKEIAERFRAEKVQNALYQISESIHTVQDLPSLYAEVRAIIMGLMPANNFYIALIDPFTGLLTFPYFVDEVDSAPEPRPIRRGITDYVIRTGKPLLANLKKIAELKEAGEYVQTGAPAEIWLGVPLILPDKTVGAMAVQDYRDEHAFGEEEKQILTFVAGQTALAIARKRAEAELLSSAARLRQSEERFATAFRSSPAMLSIARLDDGRYLDANDTFLRAAGYEREEVIGRDSVELGFFEDSPGREMFFRTLRDKGSIQNVEAIFGTRSGAKRILLLSAEFIQIDQVPCLLSAAVDITERKQAEEELLRALARERELSELKSNFVSMVSHEFRTPLGIILSSSEILERYFHKIDQPSREEHLRAIQQSTRRMASMMEAVLLFGKMEAGKLEFEPADLDLPALCQRVTHELISATDHRCPIHFRSELSSSGACGDEALLRHILSNLLANAVKYSAPGCPVEFILWGQATEAIFEIRDQGLGIPANDLEHIFDAFNRGGNVGHLPGTGLGLAVVKRCVELHGGRIELESSEGAGTTVVIRLPLFPEHRTRR